MCCGDIYCHTRDMDFTLSLLGDTHLALPKGGAAGLPSYEHPSGKKQEGVLRPLSCSHHSNAPQHDFVF